MPLNLPKYFSLNPPLTKGVTFKSYIFQENKKKTNSFLMISHTLLIFFIAFIGSPDDISNYRSKRKHMNGTQTEKKKNLIPFTTSFNINYTDFLFLEERWHVKDRMMPIVLNSQQTRYPPLKPNLNFPFILFKNARTITARSSIL